MAKIINNKIRQKILNECKLEENKSKVARKYGVSPSFVCKLLKNSYESKAID